MSVTSASILGCGWLGFPLAKALLRKGFRVKGSTTTPSKRALLREAGIEDHLIRVEPPIEGDDPRTFFSSDTLFLNFPPGGRDPEKVRQYPDKTRIVLEHAWNAGVRQVIFVSSTSVYPSPGREVDETEPPAPVREGGKAVLEAERILRELYPEKSTILRMSGLVGYDRIPGRFLAGKKEVKNGGAPVNLIHQDDAVQLAVAVLEQEAWGKVYNGCASAHPSRKEFYTKAAEMAGLEPPVFKDEPSTSFKIVSGAKAREELGVRFRYPDPMMMLAT